MPTMKSEKFNLYDDALVLLIARWIVAQDSLSEIKDLLFSRQVNWEKVQALLSFHEISSLAYPCLKNLATLIPSLELEKLRHLHYCAVANLLEKENEFCEISIYLGNANIDLVPLKGMAFLFDRIYGGLTGLRSMADIDILVKKERLSDVERILTSSGYQKELGGLKESYWLNNNYHLKFAKSFSPNRSSLLEVHWLLDYPRKIDLLPHLWDRVRQVTSEDKKINLLSPEETLFCLVLHLRRFGRVLSLKSACDCACLLSKYKNLDWDYILKESKRGEMCASLYFRLIQANLFFGLQIPKLVFKEISFFGSRNLIKEFILKNTFRTQQGKDNVIFLKHHFLVYDTIRDSAKMVVNMPQEQFAKFFQIPPYNFLTKILYLSRLVYLPYYAFTLLVRTVICKICKILMRIMGFQ
mgnify:CR=1 FL=1